MTAFPALYVVGGYDELVEAFRGRMDAAGISHEKLDEISGLQSGYSAKLLSPGKLKTFGRMSFDAMLGALSLKLVVIVDEKTSEKMARRFTAREKKIRILKRLSIAAQKAILENLSEERLVKEVMRGLGRKGGIRSGKARVVKITPERRREIARHASRARWGVSLPKLTSGKKVSEGA